MAVGVFVTAPGLNDVFCTGRQSVPRGAAQTRTEPVKEESDP